MAKPGFSHACRSCSRVPCASCEPCAHGAAACPVAAAAPRLPRVAVPARSRGSCKQLLAACFSLHAPLFAARAQHHRGLSADEQRVGQVTALKRLVEFLDHGRLHGAYALKQYKLLHAKVEEMPAGEERDDLEERARLMGAACLLHVHGHAHELKYDGWSRESMRQLVLDVEGKITQLDLEAAHDVLCSDSQLTCGIFGVDRQSLGLVVHFTAGVKQVSAIKTSTKLNELRLPFTPTQVVAAACAQLREQQQWFADSFPEGEDDEEGGQPILGLLVKDGRSFKDCIVEGEQDRRGEAAPSLTAELYSKVNSEAIEHSLITVKLTLQETLAAYRKRTGNKRVRASGAENQDANGAPDEEGERAPAAKRLAVAVAKKPAQLVTSSGGAGDVADKAFETLFNQYGQELGGANKDQPKYSPAQITSIYNKYNQISVVAQLADFHKKHPDIDFEKVRENKAMILGAAKAWHDYLGASKPVREAARAARTPRARSVFARLTRARHRAGARQPC